MSFILFAFVFLVCDSPSFFFHSGELDEKLNHDSPIKNWIFIPAGSYLSGSNPDTLCIDHSFFISKFEVTNQQYLVYLNKVLAEKTIRVHGNKVIGVFRGDSVIQPGYYPYFYFKQMSDEDVFEIRWNKFALTNDKFKDHPVTNVTWFGAHAFAKHYGYRLPTSLEWEKAARGSNENKYPWGDTLSFQHANYFNSGDPFDNGTTPVGFYNEERRPGIKTKDNRSVYGVYDLTGNVSEWTCSSSILYPEYKIYRGGSWKNYAKDLPNYPTSEAGPTLATGYIGLRCVMTD